MLGAIAGDIIGSPYEKIGIKTTVFPLFCEDSNFTDDTVLSVAIADAIMNDIPFKERLLYYYHRNPSLVYGDHFVQWANSDDHKPYFSFGNGSAMRVCPVGWAYDSIEETLSKAKETAECTHNHPEGIKGAQAVAAAVFMARNGKTKTQIKYFIHTEFGYDLNRKLDDIRPLYHFDATCMGTVPEAIISFFESSDFESAIRNAVSIGGDSDTIACIAGGIAEAFYGGVPEPIRSIALDKINLPWFVVDGEHVVEENPLFDVTTAFFERYVNT